MTVKNVMTTRVATCRPETNLAEATALMWDNDCGALPVLGETGDLAGIVTDRDICIALGTRNVRSSDVCVRDVIKDHTLVCKSSDDIHTALQTMRKGKIRRLPVVDDYALLEGIVSMDDVVLNAEPDGKMGSVISYGDVVTALQAIYLRGDQFGRQSFQFNRDELIFADSALELPRSQCLKGGQSYEANNVHRRILFPGFNGELVSGSQSCLSPMGK